MSYALYKRPDQMKLLVLIVLIYATLMLLFLELFIVNHLVCFILRSKI